MKNLCKNTLPDNCWIFEKRQYRYHGKNFLQLPYVNSEYECILKDLGIPYRKLSKWYSNEFTEVCEYWSTEMFEETERTLPLLAKMPDGSYIYCEKNYTGKVPTEETVNAALETEQFIRIELEKYKKKLLLKKHYNFAKQQLADNIATVCISTDTPYTNFYDIKMNNEHFKILRVYGKFYFTDWVAILDMNKICSGGLINLHVPKDIAGLVIGKSGTNIQSWAREIGVKKIQVIPI
jgi:hypothetical protein